MFLLPKGGGGLSIDTRMGGPLTRILVKIQKKILCIACGIGANVVGTNALYLLHLCGGYGAHVGHLLQFLHAFTLFFAVLTICFPCLSPFTHTRKPDNLEIAHVDVLTPSLHQCEDYGPGSTCKA